MNGADDRAEVDDTPRSKANKLITSGDATAVRKELVFGFALSENIRKR